MPPSDELPSYEPLLDAYHDAFAVELQAMIDTLPVREGDTVLEIACGDGAYTPWLARRVGATGAVLAVDVDPAYLRVARGKSSRSSRAARIGHVAAPIERLPLGRDKFDLVWCAQSLYSLPDPLAAVRIMADAARPGGAVAVLENDTVHQIVLPWPVEVELAVRLAELAAFKAETSAHGRYYVGRRLGALFREAGLVEVEVRSFATTRQAPLAAPERKFLVAYLADLRDRVADRLDPTLRAAFLGLADDGSPEGLVNWPDLAFTCLDHVVSGRKPG